MLIGDFNARTGELNDFIVSDTGNHVPIGEYYTVDTDVGTRHNCDKEVNEY